MVSGNTFDCAIFYTTIVSLFFLNALQNRWALSAILILRLFFFFFALLDLAFMPYFCQFICLYSALPLWYCNIRRRIKSLRTKLSARVISALLCGEFGDRKSCRQEKGKNLIQRVQRSNPLAHLRHKSAIMSEMSSKITSSPLPKCHPHFTDYPIIGTFISLSSIVGACASVPCIWKWTTNFHCFREKFCHYRWLRMNRFATSTTKNERILHRTTELKEKTYIVWGSVLLILGIWVVWMTVTMAGFAQWRQNFLLWFF